MRSLLLLITALTLGQWSLAQCGLGQHEIVIDVHTDNWGYEVFWELLSPDESCGGNAIFSGGNALEVGCAGGGEQDATGGNGYGNNQVISEGPWCLNGNAAYQIVYVDDWGDGGTDFDLYVDGQLVQTFNGTGIGQTFNFSLGLLDSIPTNDSICNAAPIPVNGVAVSFSNLNAGPEPSEPAPPGTGCGAMDGWCVSDAVVQNSVWFTFVAPMSGSVEASTCQPGNTFDTQLAIWETSNCADSSTFNLMVANDDVPGGCSDGSTTYASVVTACLTPGQTYFLQIDGWGGASGLSELMLSDGGVSSIQTTSVNVLCNGQYDANAGSIDLEVSGNPQGISWTGPNGFTSNQEDITDLEPGQYIVEIMAGCAIWYDTVMITEPTAVVVQVDSTTDVTCNGAGDGSIYISVTGGVGNYTYDWWGPGGFQDSIEDVSNLGAGTFGVQVSDSSGCAFVSYVDLVDFTAIPLDLGPDTIICDGDYLVLNAPIGTSYQWQDGSPNQFFVVDGQQEGIGQHLYWVTITNAGGCIAADSILVEVESCLGTSEKEEVRISAYPNPTRNQLTVEGALPGEAWRLIDLSGRVVAQGSAAPRFEIDLSALAAGPYTLELSSSVAVRRLVIIRAN